jgi:8-oxo-dGTP pyrophosphatase MutT (NUDIX family)
MKKGDEQKMEVVFEGQIVRVETGIVPLPDRQQMAFEVVRHPGGAAIVALDGAGRVCLLRQYRVVMDDWLWELPAGKIDDGEPPLETAQRELAEEAACAAQQWTSLGAVISSPGVFDELVHLYLATGLSPAQADSEAHEIFDVHWLPLDEALAWARTGKIADAKTIVALFRAQERLA